MFTGMIGCIIIASQVCLVIAIVLYVARWMLFEKLGVRGWKSLIPFYDAYSLAKRTKGGTVAGWVLGLDVVTYVLGIIGVALKSESSFYESTVLYGCLDAPYSHVYSHTAGLPVFGSIVLLAAMVALLVLMIGVLDDVSREFGHGHGFTVGLVLLPVVFVPILAFDDDAKVKCECDDDCSCGDDCECGCSDDDCSCGSGCECGCSKSDEDASDEHGATANGDAIDKADEPDNGEQSEPEQQAKADDMVNETKSE